MLSMVIFECRYVFIWCVLLQWAADGDVRMSRTTPLLTRHEAQADGAHQAAATRQEDRAADGEAGRESAIVLSPPCAAWTAVIGVPARLRKGQGAKEIGHDLARERPKCGHNLVRKRHKNRTQFGDWTTKSGTLLRMRAQNLGTIQHTINFVSDRWKHGHKSAGIVTVHQLSEKTKTSCNIKKNNCHSTWH